jgi:hypothetical protein
MTDETERDPRWQANRKRRIAQAQSDFAWMKAQRDAAGTVHQTLSLAEQCVHLDVRVIELEEALRQGQQLVLEAQQRAQSIAKRCQQLQDEAAASRKLAHAVSEYLTCYTERLGDMKKAFALHELREAADKFHDALR